MSRLFVAVLVILLATVMILDRQLGAMMLLFSLFVIGNERSKGNP